MRLLPGPRSNDSAKMPVKRRSSEWRTLLPDESAVYKCRKVVLSGIVAQESSWFMQRPINKLAVYMRQRVLWDPRRMLERTLLERKGTRNLDMSSLELVSMPFERVSGHLPAEY